MTHTAYPGLTPALSSTPPQLSNASKHPDNNTERMFTYKIQDNYKTCIHHARYGITH